ncbi:hypothetical protein PYW07_003352 [Mythimna separata]|uniref:Reverse transcriptase domain-containing protein n=1 Tax=Mythimna separata TaxID=271217 RepID=A0AAD8DRW2_MYTSE|nr:hypothetical protein PYW07_003352 [Mythimna separata]
MLSLIAMASITKHHDFSLYYQNSRGIRTKLNTLYMNILSNCFDVIVLTETWLIPAINNQEFIDKRYIVFRCDRNRTATGKSDGGGVLIAVLRKYNPICVPSSQFGTLDHYLEQTAIMIPSNNNSSNTLIHAAYVPNNLPFAVYDAFFNNMDNLIDSIKTDNILLLGDYNIPIAQWVRQDPTQSYMTCLGTTPTCNRLRDFLIVHDVKQFNHISNPNGRILDLLISDANCTVLKPNLDLLPVDSHHPPFYTLLSLNINISLSKPLHTPKYNYRRADYTAINKDIDEICWEGILESNSTDECIDAFYNCLYGIIKNRIPLSTPPNSHFPVWFSKPLIHIFKYKKKAWSKWKKYRNISDYEVFSLYRARFKDECHKCFQKYINSVEDGISKDVTHFWVYIANRQGKSGIPTCMSYGNVTSSDSVDICNLFSTFFQSVYEPSSLSPGWHPPSDLRNVNSSSLCTINFTVHEVRRQLKMLDTNKGPGPDDIPPYFLKSTAETICKPLSMLFNKCIQSGTFPSLWKQANIIPVHKSGPRQDIENYRPISILCALAKIFEKLVHQAIYPFLRHNIIPEQHGFVKNKSTVTNLMIFTEHLFSDMDAGSQTDAVYTDFKKAFDRVDHSILLNKIAFNGIRGNLLRWFCSYISNRNQVVVCNGYKSDSFVATSGVPQGSILGPLMFIIYINDICSCFKNSNFLLYADDLKVFRTIKNTADCDLLQEDLNRLSAYCDENKLKLSLPKCKFINFTKNKKVIPFDYSLCNSTLFKETYICDLGVLLDSKLHLNLHIDKITSKAYQLYNFVMRATSDFKRPATYLYLFKSLVRPQVEYACMIWDPYYTKYEAAVERVQRKFLSIMQYKCRNKRLPYKDALNRFKLLSLHSRRLLLQGMMLHGLVNNRFDCSELISKLCYIVPRTVTRREARSYPLFATTPCRTNAGKRAPLQRVVRVYNDNFNDVDVFALTKNKFKKEIIKRLAESY